MKLDFLSPSTGEGADQIDGWFTPRRFALLLALLILALFPGVIFGDSTFVFRDFGLFGYPMAFYFRDSFWRGEIPLWNPLNCSGLPFLAQWSTLVITAGQRPMFLDDRESLRGLFDPSFDPSRTVFLPLEAKSSVTVANASQPRVGSRKFSPHRITFEVEAGERAMAVIAQAYYHPWRAYVDGAPVRLWRANHAFQALEVPAGRHRVALVYEDNNFRYGALISGAALFGCGAGLVWFRRKR